jgi:nucleotide-binding universal stress UspA family protein
MKLKVLVPLDNTTFSRQILGYLGRYLDPTKHELVFFRVVPRVQAFVPGPMETVPVGGLWAEAAYRSHRDANLAKHPIYLDQIQSSVQAQIEDELQSDAKPFQEAGFQVSVIVKFDHDPAQEILNYVDTGQIDLLAMTTHSREGIRRLLFGSVAEKVLHHTTVPVLLVHPETV